MSIEVLPLGMKCGAKCTYCYQEPVRDAGNEEVPSYDMDAMKATLRKEGWKFSVFGGEPLLVPIMDLAELWRFGYEEVGKKSREEGGCSNGIQTMGVQVSSKHIELMNRYDVGVGVSIDGPGELNDARRYGPTLESTRAATAKTEKNLGIMLQELKRKPSIIVTLHKENGRPDRLPKLLAWLEKLHEQGMPHVNVHFLEQDTAASIDLTLTDEDTIGAFRQMWDLHKRTGLRIAPLMDMQTLLLNHAKTDKSKLSCIWNGCDPKTTDAVHGVGPNGESFNCGRTYKDGIMAIKANSTGYERSLQLYYTPQDLGGCQGCRFFYACNGNCPGTGEDGDWRKRTSHCAILMGIFGFLETDIVSKGAIPFSIDPRRDLIEKMMVEQWKMGKRPDINYTTKAYGRGDTYNNVGLPGHLDVPHTDWHTDSELDYEEVEDEEEN